MTNEMTAKEAVKILKDERDHDIFVATEYREKLHEALDKAIKALEQQPCDDCISREHAKQFLYYEIERLHDDGLYDCFARIIDDMYNELPSVIPKYTDEEIDKIQAVEQAYVDKMVELAVEETKRPKGKWIEYKVDIAPHPLHCSLCGFSNHHISNRYMREFRRCPNCGAEMEEG